MTFRLYSRICLHVWTELLIFPPAGHQSENNVWCFWQELSHWTLSHTVSINLPSADLSLSLMGNGSSRSPPQGLYQEVTDLRFRVTDIENERLLCEKKLKATKVSVLKVQFFRHFILLHWTLTGDLNYPFETLHYMFKTLWFSPHDIDSLLPFLTPFFYCDFNISLQHANLSSIRSGALSGSLEARWTRFNLQPVLFFLSGPLRSFKPAPLPLLHAVFLTFTTLAVSALTCTGFRICTWFYQPFLF